MSFLPSEHSYRQALISLPSAAQLNPATVRKGSSGSTVRTLHAYLMPAIHSSLSGSMLGNEYSNKTFGASTEAYVKQFQKKSGLTADGIVGPNTWSALGLGKAQPAAPAASRGGVLRRLWHLNLPVGLEGDSGTHYSGQEASSLSGETPWRARTPTPQATSQQRSGRTPLAGTQAALAAQSASALSRRSSAT